MPSSPGAPELKQEIFNLIPSYDYRTNWRRTALGRRAQLADNLDYIANSFDQGVRLTRYCGDKFGWDVLMIVFKLVDNLQHKAWKYLDPRTSGRFPYEAELAARCFGRLDDALGELLMYARQNSATVLIMSRPWPWQSGRQGPAQSAAGPVGLFVPAERPGSGDTRVPDIGCTG